MPIYFRKTPVNEPFTFDSVGNHWNQENVTRQSGHPLYHYLQTEKGRGKIVIQGKDYILNEGEGVLIAPFVMHSYFRETEEWNTLFATITGTIESSISKMLGNRPFIFVEKEQGKRIEALIAEVVKKQESAVIDAKEISNDCYQLLLYFVDGMYTRERKRDSLYQRYVEPVLKQIETRFGENLTVGELSQQIFITPQYLSRLFDRFFGCSVYEYLTNYRINKAKELLITDSGMKVQEIAGRVGFSDVSHFIVIFKKMTGVTPLEYRKMN